MISKTWVLIRRLILATALSLACCGSVTTFAAQAPAKVPRLTLASATGVPGGSLVVPLYLDSESVALGTIHFETTFVSRNLKLQRFTAGSAAEAADTQVSSSSSESTDDKGLEHTTLTIRLKASDKSRPIPGGLLGYISLRVSEKAGPAIINFRSTVEATLAEDSSREQTVEIIDDQVEIIAEGSEPLISCFFFTH